MTIRCSSCGCAKFFYTVPGKEKVDDEEVAVRRPPEVEELAVETYRAAVGEIDDVGASGRGLLDVGGGHDGSLVDWGRGSLLSGLSGLGALGGVDGVNDSLVNDVDILHLLVLSGLGPGEVGRGDGRAGKGEDGGGVTHFDCVVEFGSKL